MLRPEFAVPLLGRNNLEEGPPLKFVPRCSSAAQKEIQSLTMMMTMMMSVCEYGRQERGQSSTLLESNLYRHLRTMQYRSRTSSLIFYYTFAFLTARYFSTTSSTIFTSTTTTPSSSTSTFGILFISALSVRSRSAHKQRQQSQEQKSMIMTTAKPRILCLHGRCQSGSILSNKIAGARRKLERVYELDFLDGPILLNPPTTTTPDDTSNNDNKDDPSQQQPQQQQQFAWWNRNEETGQNLHVQQAFDYVINYVQSQKKPYDAIIGFSQGGALATTLLLSGKLPSTIQALITAGSPFTKEAYDIAMIESCNNNNNNNNDDDNDDRHFANNIPKLHFAGQNDTMVPVESTTKLCEMGGNGELIVHEKGHLFPTKAVHTNYMIEFLAKHVVAIDKTTTAK